MGAAIGWLVVVEEAVGVSRVFEQLYAKQA